MVLLVLFLLPYWFYWTFSYRLLNISEIRFRVSMAMSPSQRPRGVLGFWSSLMTALGNMEHMPVGLLWNFMYLHHPYKYIVSICRLMCIYFRIKVRIAQRYREELCMRQSALMNAAISNIQKDLLSQPLQLLSGVDILGNASSALSNMSKGIAALSMDKKFIQDRMRQVQSCFLFFFLLLCICIWHTKCWIHK